VAEKLGRCEIFAGVDVDATGRLSSNEPANLTVDRLYMRHKLTDIMDNRALRFAIRRLDVYAPCAVLHGICLMDGPGTWLEIFKRKSSFHSRSSLLRRQQRPRRVQHQCAPGMLSCRRFATGIVSYCDVSNCTSSWWVSSLT